MCLVDYENGPGGLSDFAQDRVEPRVRQYHTDIGHHRLGQDARDIAGRESGFKCWDVVEFDDAGQFVEIARLADQCRIGLLLAVFETDESLIDGTMITAIEDEDLFPSGDGAAPA